MGIVAGNAPPVLRVPYIVDVPVFALFDRNIERIPNARNPLITKCDSHRAKSAILSLIRAVLKEENSRPTNAIDALLVCTHC